MADSGEKEKSKSKGDKKREGSQSAKPKGDSGNEKKEKKEKKKPVDLNAGGAEGEKENKKERRKSKSDADDEDGENDKVKDKGKKKKKKKPKNDTDNAEKEKDKKTEDEAAEPGEMKDTDQKEEDRISDGEKGQEDDDDDNTMPPSVFGRSSVTMSGSGQAILRRGSDSDRESEDEGADTEDSETPFQGPIIWTSEEVKQEVEKRMSAKLEEDNKDELPPEADGAPEKRLSSGVQNEATAQAPTENIAPTDIITPTTRRSRQSKDSSIGPPEKRLSSVQNETIPQAPIEDIAPSDIIQPTERRSRQSKDSSIPGRKSRSSSSKRPSQSLNSVPEASESATTTPPHSVESSSNSLFSKAVPSIPRLSVAKEGDRRVSSNLSIGVSPSRSTSAASEVEFGGSPEEQLPLPVKDQPSVVRPIVTESILKPHDTLKQTGSLGNGEVRWQKDLTPLDRGESKGVLRRSSVQFSDKSEPVLSSIVSNQSKPASGNFGRRYPNTSEVTYDSMQRVRVKVLFSKVSDIDTLGQQFAAEVHVQARWTEPGLKGKSEQELDEIPFGQCWNPKLVILNLVGGLEKDSLSIMVRYEEEEVHPVVTYMWSVKAVFMETLELEHFPFDTQELSVVLSSERPLDEIDIVPDSQSISSVSVTAIKDAQEWKSFRHVEFTQDFRSSDFYNSSMHPVLIASAHVRRRLGFYMWNIFIIVFLILGLSLTILSFDPTGGDRLGVTMTLFLTCVAFKLVVKTTLPHISYLTYLDIYVVFTMMYLAAQAAENAIISHLARFRQRDKVIFYDEIAQSTLIALLVLFHAVFLIYIRLTAFSRRRSMEEKDHEYHLKIARAKRDTRRESQNALQLLEDPTSKGESDDDDGQGGNGGQGGDDGNGGFSGGREGDVGYPSYFTQSKWGFGDTRNSVVGATKENLTRASGQKQSNLRLGPNAGADTDNGPGDGERTLNPILKGNGQSRSQFIENEPGNDIGTTTPTMKKSADGGGSRLSAMTPVSSSNKLE